LRVIISGHDLDSIVPPGEGVRRQGEDLRTRRRPTPTALTLAQPRDAEERKDDVREHHHHQDDETLIADPKYGHFTNDRSLKQSEIDTLVKWADTGAVEGVAKDAPAPINWPKDGWLIQPEVVMELPPHDVPAKGVLE
jgi:hypothetical protein